MMLRGIALKKYSKVVITFSFGFSIVSFLTLSDMGEAFWPLISYTVGLARSPLFYSHKIDFYTFWSNLDKFFAEGHEI